MKFTEASLEQAVLELFGEAEVGIPHFAGHTFRRDPSEVLLKDDLRAFLFQRYKSASPNSLKTRPAPGKNQREKQARYAHVFRGINDPALVFFLNDKRRDGAGYRKQCLYRPR